MGLSKSAVIPIASLTAIVVVSLAFIIWWFPRTWSRGNAEEQRLYDQQIRERDAYLANLRANQAAVNRPGDEESGTDAPPSETAEAKPPPYVAQRPYVPPVTAY